MLWSFQTSHYVMLKINSDFSFPLKEDVIEEVSNDGSQPPKRRRMGSGDSSRSCDTSSQDLG